MMSLKHTLAFFRLWRLEKVSIEKKVEGNLEEKLLNVETALYQIHGLAALLEAAGEQFEGLYKNETSCPLTTLGGIIREKTQFCLNLIEDLEKQGVPT